MNLSAEKFVELSKIYNIIPLYREFVADLDTPVGAYLKLNRKPSFLLESVVGGEKWGRYSFIGIDPKILIKFEKKTITVKKDSHEEIFANANPFIFLRDYFSNFNAYIDPELPRFFGGMVGYISYDTVKVFEKVPDLGKKSLNVPEIFLMIPETILIFDNLKQSVKIVINAFIDGESKEIYDKANKKIDEIIQLFKHHEDERFRNYFLTPLNNKSNIEGFRSNFTKKGFLNAVKRAREYVLSGDVVQVVISQRFETKMNCHPFDVYRALRIINPSPYMFYIDTEDIHLIGSSPEILVRLEDEKITLRPIAGTRRRGKTEEEDLALEKELLMDEKERAEHIMLVDLGRNDVGRVAEIGSVNVTELMTI
ncbi:MAG: chorismate-binding protein, partial [Thermodesulfovibrio sp.]|nr:chorismate-binding protein [Thermodesulfovibrio sp.]